MCGLHKGFEVTDRSEEGCLNTQGRFSLGSELALNFFLIEKFATKLNQLFIVLRKMKVFTPIWDRQVVFLL